MGTASPMGDLAVAAAGPRKNPFSTVMRLVGKLIRLCVIVFLVLLAAGTALEFAVPKDALRALCVQKLQQKLRRQVKMTSLSVGPWRGLRVDGLQISEAPDFAAGTFLKAERITVRPKFLPLLAGRIVVGQVALVEPELRVLRTKDGRYNVTGILDASAAAPAVAPSSGAAAAAKPAEPKVDLIAFLTKGWDKPDRKVGEFGALVAAAGAGAASRLAGAVAKLTVDVEVLRVRRGAFHYEDQETGLKLSASEVTVWAEGLTPRSLRTEVNVDGKATGTINERPAEAEFVLDARMELDAKYYPVASSGHLILNKVRHPSFQTDRLRAEWDLRGLSSDLTAAAGVVKLEGSAGQLINPAFISRQGKWPALLLYPVQVLAKYRGLGLPDMEKLDYTELRGEYSFQNGAVNLAPVYLRGPVISINAEGALNLPLRTVGLKANVIMGKTSVGVLIKGLMDAPSVESEVSFKGPPKKSRTVHQVVGKPAVLEQRFNDSDAPTPAGAGASSRSKAATAKANAKAAAEANRPNTLKDAESLIDAPLPE